jgi:tetratricopeptide (TPR) repeat protein
MKNFTIVCFLLFAFHLVGYSSTPPDSTLTLFEKAEIKLLISDGRNYFGEDNYRSALVKFREALNVNKHSADANYWIAECHLGLHNYDVALKYALTARDLDPEVNDELNYVLGVSYHKLGQFDNALSAYKQAYQTLSKSRKRDLRLDTKIAECERGLIDSKKPADIKMKPLGPEINSRHDDYGAVLSSDGQSIYFSSRKAQNTGGGFSSGDNKYFSDIFIANWDSKTNQWMEANNLDDRIKSLNSEGFDDIAFLSSDGKTLYLSVNTEGILNTKTNTQSTDIFYSELDKNNFWSPPKPMDRTVNSIGFEASPTFTKDGKTMYFISERMGGFGRADIWTSTFENGKWLKPTNLGGTINTPFQETTVFVSEDGNYLFFSSDGHDGYGGYDVYVSKKTGDSWSAPVNLGFPINGVSDETHFVYYPAHKKGYYSKLSTKENGGLGYRDIFEIDLSNFEVEKLF